MKNTESRRLLIKQLTDAADRELSALRITKQHKADIIKRLSMSYYYIFLQKDEAIRQKMEAIKEKRISSKAQ